MKEILVKKLHQYIMENNPDLLIQLEEEGKVAEYLLNKVSSVDGLINQQYTKQPIYIIEDTCMDVLTKDLKPSKFNYIRNVLEEDFETSYLQLQKSGVLKFEVLNLLTKCHSVFNDLNFSEENENNRFIRYCIVGTISEYLDERDIVKMN